MTIVSKFALIAAAAVVGLASPAFAQSFDPEVGTGNIVGFSVAPTAQQNSTFAAHQNGHRKIAVRRSG